MSRLPRAFLFLLVSLASHAQPALSPEATGAQAAARHLNAPIVLGSDDKAVFPAAPAGFDHKRDGIARGKVALVEYHSNTVGADRHMLIYTPPIYSKDTTYPVLYLLHGIGGDERE